MNYFYNTLDLDWEIPRRNEGLSCSRELADRILNKIVKCKYCVVASKELSNLKGYHIKFYCTRKCDICKLQFDDQKRYIKSLTQPEICKDIIWDIKMH
jgi:hypothetical protein